MGGMRRRTGATFGMEPDGVHPEEAWPATGRGLVR